MHYFHHPIFFLPHGPVEFLLTCALVVLVARAVRS